MKHSAFLRSAAVLSAGGIVAKGIGALYRIPLSNLLGGYGIGLYQMAYPLFCLLLTFSSSGVPTALSRIVARETARGGSGTETLKSAFKLFALVGLCGTALMCLFAPHMSKLQGDGGLLFCYFALAPSVFFVSLIAVLRGWFQGKNDMTPTAVSEIAEQLFKAGFGLFFATRFANEPQKAVAYALFSVTLSELFALTLLLLRLAGTPKTRFLCARRVYGGEILFSALPVMAATMLLPLSQTVDSVVLVRLLGGKADAVSLYGLFSGGALPLVSLPATLCYGLAAAAVPSVSRAVALGDAEEGKRRAVSALLFTLCLSVPCALGLFLFARPVVSLLYASLPAAEEAILVRLLKLVSLSAVTLAGVDTLAACLVGMGRAKRAALSMFLAVIFKFALQWALVPRFSAEGAAIAANGCYLVAFFLDLFYTVKKPKERANDLRRELGRRDGGSDPQREERAVVGGRSARADERNSLRADA